MYCSMLHLMRQCIQLVSHMSHMNFMGIAAPSAGRAENEASAATRRTLPLTLRADFTDLFTNILATVLYSLDGEGCSLGKVFGSTAGFPPRWVVAGKEWSETAVGTGGLTSMSGCWSEVAFLRNHENTDGKPFPSASAYFGRCAGAPTACVTPVRMRMGRSLVRRAESNVFRNTRETRNSACSVRTICVRRGPIRQIDGHSYM